MSTAAWRKAVRSSPRWNSPRAAWNPTRAGIGDALHAATERLRDHAPLDPDIADAVQLLGEAAINCEEARSSISNAMSRLDLSPERLQEVEQQLRGQYDLARKHRVEPEQLAEGPAEPAAPPGTRRLRWTNACRKSSRNWIALLDYRQAAQSLHEARSSRAHSLSAAVTELMQELGMEGGQFEFEVDHDPESGVPLAQGNDRLELRVSANPGTAPGPLRKVASGGELSRISLAIKVASKAG